MKQTSTFTEFLLILLREIAHSLTVIYWRFCPSDYVNCRLTEVWLCITRNRYRRSCRIRSVSCSFFLLFSHRYLSEKRPPKICKWMPTLCKLMSIKESNFSSLRHPCFFVSSNYENFQSPFTLSWSEALSRSLLQQVRLLLGVKVPAFVPYNVTTTNMY